MKFYKTQNLYKASNVTFNPDTIQAYSYKWWLFVSRIGNKVVFNDYNYSNTTLRHQAKIRSLLKELGIKVDLTITAPLGLQNPASAIDFYQIKIKTLKAEIAKPNTRKAKNAERETQIKHFESKIKEVTKLINKSKEVNND